MRSIPRVLVALAVLGGVAGLATAAATKKPAPLVLPPPEPPFAGRIGQTAAESTPAFPRPTAAPKGAPNIVLIVTDDVGFGATSTFGGPVPTPTFDRLAEHGLRYTRFHTTSLCSPTRAALLTGRNHHQCGTGVVTEIATGFPGYDSIIPRSCGTVAEVLHEGGYATAWFGKNHNVPVWETSAAGPFDRWPRGLGFDYFYGFVGGDTNQYEPALYENTTPVNRPREDEGYILDRDLADHAIRWVQAHEALTPDTPYFVYYATGTSHAPHSAPKEWIAKFRGRFDDGWDALRERTLARQKALGIVPADTVLTPRPDGIPAWDSLDAEHQRVYAHMMEVYAGALAFADHEIGRVLDAVAASGDADNTLVVFVQGDNGASAEGGVDGTTNEIATLANRVEEPFSFLAEHVDDLGGPLAYDNYPVGWAHALDTPFQWTKQIASHFGGTRNGLVISWPARIHAEGGVRTQFHHVVDIGPTLLAAAGLAFPDVLDGVPQKPVAGVSMAYTYDDATAPSRRETQYFEMLGNRAIYQDGWLAATTPQRLPWENAAAPPDPTAFPWELYHVDEDFSEAHDLAAQDPEKLAELQRLFDAEAKRYDVFPLDTRLATRLAADRPSLTRGRTTFTWTAPVERVPETAAPDVKNRSWSLTAEIEVPPRGAEGVLATVGGRFAGWAVLLWEGRPAFVYARSNQPGDKTRIVADRPLAPGKHTLRVDFAYDGGGLGNGGDVTVSVDGGAAAAGRVERTVPAAFGITEGFDVGTDNQTPVVEEYAPKMPYRFTGTLDRLTIELGAPAVGRRD